MKMLFLDIETSPNTAHVWGLFKQNIAISQIMESSYVLCWAAKWADGDEIMYDSMKDNTAFNMICEVHKLLDEADVVVHYNGSRFDIPTLNKEFLLHGLPPPAPYQELDLLKVARNRFRFVSNKLEYVANALGLGNKVKHRGHQLWIDCMAGDKDAWAEMEAYNKQDAVLLEKVYNEFRPWIKNHPVRSLYERAVSELTCPTCASSNFQRRGSAVSAAGKYQRYQCSDCGSWFKAGRTSAPAIGLRGRSL
jgi:DNA polymerase elongation subunit (family B)